MEVRITSRHTDLSDNLRRRTEEVVTKLSKYEPRISAAEVVFDEEKRSKTAEGIIHVDRSDPVVASGEAEEFGGALNQMVERLSKQLRRRHDRIRDHKAPKLSEAQAEE